GAEVAGLEGGGVEAGRELAALALDHRLEQGVLAGEMGIEGGLGDAGEPRDRLHAGGAVALLHEAAAGRRQDLLRPGIRRLVRLRPHRIARAHQPPRSRRHDCRGRLDIACPARSFSASGAELNRSVQSWKMGAAMRRVVLIAVGMLLLAGLAGGGTYWWR